MSNPTPTQVFSSFWRFAEERQRIFYRRLRGESPPWTDDPVLRSYRFTNAFRASDKESQFLIGRVIGGDERSPVDTFFRILLFRLFNKADTWRLLESTVGPPMVEGFDLRYYDRVLEAAMLKGVRLFSAAYIMPSRGRGLSARRKHTNLLLVLERMLDDEVPERVFDLSAEQAFDLLHSYPMIGRFLAYQYVTDLGYSGLASFREGDFVAPGPGALDGVRKCFNDLHGWTPADVIRWVCDNQVRLAEASGCEAPQLFGRPLQLIDCQNLFCEIDKYARVAYPALAGRSGRTKIKRRYQPTLLRPLPRPCYPKKWGLDSNIERFYGRGDGLQGLSEECA